MKRIALIAGAIAEVAFVVAAFAIGLACMVLWVASALGYPWALEATNEVTRWIKP